MAEYDFIDITPKGIGDGQGMMGLKNTVFTEEEKYQILENPGRLTKEGIEEKIKLWKQSINKHIQIKYTTMLKLCKNIKPSGKTIVQDRDGEWEYIILSYNEDGTPRWKKPNPDYVPKEKKK